MVRLGSERIAPLQRNSASRNSLKYVEHKDGKYRSRIRVNGKLRTIARGNTESECALRTVEWFEGTYGPKWSGVLRWFYRRQWKPEYEITWSDASGCYLLTAWVFGERTPLFPDRAYPQKTIRHIGFATSMAARVYLHWWLKTNYGAFSEYVLWRAEG